MAKIVSIAWLVLPASVIIWALLKYSSHELWSGILAGVGMVIVFGVTLVAIILVFG